MRPLRQAEYRKMQNDFDLVTRGMAHFSVVLHYTDNSTIPTTNVVWEEPGFYSMLVPRQPGTRELNYQFTQGQTDAHGNWSLQYGMTIQNENRTIAPALMKIPKRFFTGGFKVIHPNAPAAVQGAEFSLGNYYLPEQVGDPLPEQQLLVRYLVLRSNYGDAPIDVAHEGNVYSFDTAFYESADAVTIELRNENNGETFLPFPNYHLLGVTSPEVTTLIGRYGRDAALEMLGLT